MAAERKLTVVLAGDAKGAVAAFDKVESRGKTFGGKMAGLGGKAKLALAGAGAGALAFGKSSIDAFMEAEQAQAQLTAAFEKFPQLAGQNADALRDLNSELATKTKFDDDATASGQAVLAQFGLTADQLAQITPLMQDYAERTGKDLPTAAKDLGKAVQGQGKALKGVGIQFKDTGSAAGNFEQLMGGLDQSVGGFAETAGDTTAGKVAILKNQFGELQESVGSKLVPALSKLADWLFKVGDWLSDHKPVLIAFAAVIGTGLVVAFTAWAVSAATAAAATIAAAAPILLIIGAIALLAAGVIYAYTHFGWFRTAVDTVARFFTDTLWPAMQAVAGWITGTLIPTVTSIGQAFIDFGATVINAVMAAFNWVRDNWPLILAVLTGPIGLAVLAITRHWDTIKAGVTAVKDWIVARFNDVKSFLSSLAGGIGMVLSGVADAIKAPFVTAFNAIKSLWNSTVGGFGFSVPSWVPGVGGKSFEIPSMHTGGIFDSGRGEGPVLLKDGEGVFTPAQMAALTPVAAHDPSPAALPPMTFDFRGAVITNDMEFERMIRDVIQNTVNRQGRIPGTNIVKATA